MGTYCRTHGVARVVCGCTMSCDEARTIRLKLTGQTPHTPTPLEMQELAEPDDPPQTRVCAPESRSDAQAGDCMSAASSAGREPHSKPLVRKLIGGWVIEVMCCDDPEKLDQTAFATQPEALDAALAHVREHHQSNPCDGGPVDLDELADQIDPAQAMWADAYHYSRRDT